MHLHSAIVFFVVIALANCVKSEPPPSSSPRGAGTTATGFPGDADREPTRADALRTPDAGATDVVAFWRDAGPSLWFAKRPDFDDRFRSAFASLYGRAARGELDGWLSTSTGALALVLLLDQYPRNSFRGTPHMYATDELARRAADAAIVRGYDRAVDSNLQAFFYLPFGHSESLEDQERAVSLCRRLGPVDLAHAEHHRDIVKRFGRFPHRNAILAREPRPEETAYLADGGYAG